MLGAVMLGAVLLARAGAAASCAPGPAAPQEVSPPEGLTRLARRYSLGLAQGRETPLQLLRRHPGLPAAALAGRGPLAVAYRARAGPGSPRAAAAGDDLEGFRRGLEAARNSSGGWAPPFWSCLTASWLLGFAAPLHSPHRGAVGVFFSMEQLGGDPCNESLSPGAGGHRCDPETSECLPEMGEDAAAGYTCVCRPGFFSLSPRFGWRSFSSLHLDQVEDLDIYRCAPCPEQCDSCVGAGACMARTDRLLRSAVLGAQLLCMCGTAALALVVFKQRKCKTIASGMWTILEMILFGIMLLYATVVVRFFDPSAEQCLLEPWCRELGFVLCYGAIILKLYRILIEFRTRKAHRWVVRDKDLLKYLLGMVLVVLGYMAAWTATNLNFIREDYHVVELGRTLDGLQFLACKALWWDYVTETGEILILVFGVHLSYACRNAATQFQERRFLCLAICVEACVSGAFYVLRVFYAASLHPDAAYLAYFARSQLTSTVVLIVIFVPKIVHVKGADNNVADALSRMYDQSEFEVREMGHTHTPPPQLWYQRRQAGDSRAARRYTAQEFSARTPLDAFKPQDGVATPGGGEADVGEINLADMNPEDIRAELKRLYTQLEVLKNKTIRADNPHISKRRGGRKVAHRRFSLQKKGSRDKALHHRHQSRSVRHPHDHEPGEGEVSRTPEDSVCSVEGPSAIYNDGPSTYSELGAPYRAPHKQ
ncbi:probable G-protein coupled receptor 179 [Bacillus rossius redtenbacheri]|uniref:probable G-protein coupled receptor 179 n=1 Tax=Bacillus rossius redtenbacheri TaxID=93214 RepID=UPI002FDEEE0C